MTNPRGRLPLAAAALALTCAACSSASAPASTVAVSRGAAASGAAATPSASAKVPASARATTVGRAETVRVAITAHGVTPGRRTVTVPAGTRLRLVTSSYRPLEVHLHGYDIEAEVAPDHPGVVAVTATRRGTFEFEAHDERVGRLLMIRVE